jgi:hypothetical protein
MQQQQPTADTRDRSHPANNPNAPMQRVRLELKTGELVTYGLVPAFLARPDGAYPVDVVTWGNRTFTFDRLDHSNPLEDVPVFQEAFGIAMVLVEPHTTDEAAADLATIADGFTARENRGAMGAAGIPVSPGLDAAIETTDAVDGEPAPIELGDCAQNHSWSEPGTHAYWGTRELAGTATGHTPGDTRDAVGRHFDELEARGEGEAVDVLAAEDDEQEDKGGHPRDTPDDE